VPTISFSGAALAIKASIAVGTALCCQWTFASLSWLVVTATSVGWIFAALDGNASSQSLALKVGSVITLLVLLSQYWRSRSPVALHTYLTVALGTIATSLLVGLAGIGHDRYLDIQGIGLRYNGFIVAGNEANIALVGIFWWLAAQRQREHSVTPYTFLYWLCFGLMVVSQSKTTIIGAAITILYFHRLRITSILALVTIVPFLLYLFLTSAIWARWVFFYNVFADQGTLSALTGGRFSRIGDINIDFETLLAEGASILASGGGYIESDPLDLLFNFGVTGLTLYFVFALKLYAVCRPRLTSWLLVMFASIFAGHVVYSLFAAPILFAAFRAAETPLVHHVRFRLLPFRLST